MAVTRGAKRKAEMETSVDPLATMAPRALVCDGEVIDLTVEDEDWSETVEKCNGRGQKKRRTKAVKPKLSEKQVKEEGGHEGQMEPDKQEVETCGICLSEEVKEQGKLDCCDHFFCFECIMEWGKVESRCPMCKQRFRSIVRPAIRGIPRSRKKTVRVPEKNQVYEPTAEEIMAMMAPQTNIMCHYCSDVVDEGHQLVCSVCETMVAHAHCAARDGFIMDWTCRYCSDEHDVEHDAELDFNGLVLNSVMNIFEQPRRTRRHEGASFFFPSFPASRSSRRAGGARLGSTPGAGSLSRRSLTPSDHFFLEALSASIGEPAVSTSTTPASVVAPARQRSRGIPRVSRPTGVRAAAGSSARRPILISPEVINVEDDDEMPNAISYSDISLAWTLADQARTLSDQARTLAHQVRTLGDRDRTLGDRARAQLGTFVEVSRNERVRPPRNTGPRSMRHPAFMPQVASEEASSSTDPLLVWTGPGCPPTEGRRGLSMRPVPPPSRHSNRSSNGCGETTDPTAAPLFVWTGPGCPPTEGRRGPSMRPVPPPSRYSHRSSNGGGETMSLMSNLGGPAMDCGEPLHVHQDSHVSIPTFSDEAQVLSGASIMLGNSLQGSSRDRGQSNISADREKKKEVMVMDLEEPSGRAADSHAGLSEDWYTSMFEASSLSPMEEMPSPNGRQHANEELKHRIRELVKLELDPYFHSKQIERETYKKFAREATRTLHMAMLGSSEECHHHLSRGSGSSSRSAASCCNQCLKEGVKQHVGDLISPHLLQQSYGNLIFSSRSTAC